LDLIKNLIHIHAKSEIVPRIAGPSIELILTIPANNGDNILAIEVDV